MLLYKEKLLRKVKEFGIPFYRNEIIRYAEDLGFNSGEVTESYMDIRYTRDEDYEGTCPLNDLKLTNKVKYILVDKNKIAYWFTSAYDAIMFVAPDDCSIESTLGPKELFLKYRKYFYQGYYFLFPEDVEDFDEMRSIRHGIRCMDKDLFFDNEEMTVLWLVNSGKAATTGRALAQLEKHLDGATASCYGLRFERV